LFILALHLKKYPMKKLLAITFMISIYAIILNAQPYVWTQKTNFGGTARYEAVGFSIGNKGYFGTGANFTLSQIYNDLWEYDANTNTWTQKASMPASIRIRYGASGFSAGNKGYVCLGWSSMGGNPLNDLWEYDPVLNSWVQKANFPGSSRYDAIGFTINAKGYVGFGFAPNTADLWEYDPVNNSWNQKANLPASVRQSASTFSINGLGYIACGGLSTGSSFNDLWEFNPGLNTWTQKANFPGAARYATISFMINNKGYVGSGWDASISFNDFYEYDPLTNSWSPIPNLPSTARYAGDGFSLGNRGYAGLGRDGSNNYYNDFWEYGPVIKNSVNEIAGNEIDFTLFQSSAGSIQINYDVNYVADAVLTVFDYAGKCILEKMLKGKQSETVAMSLSNGIYVYTVSSRNQKIKAGKFIVR
jgi:N-acetylneuraminic acid mutarotase